MTDSRRFVTARRYRWAGIPLHGGTAGRGYLCTAVPLGGDTAAPPHRGTAERRYLCTAKLPHRGTSEPGCHRVGQQVPPRSTALCAAGAMSRRRSRVAGATTPETVPTKPSRPGAVTRAHERRSAETGFPWSRRRHTGHRWSSDEPDGELHQPPCGRASTAYCDELMTSWKVSFLLL